MLRGLLSRALRTHALPNGLVPFACELGRVRFEPGDPYHLAVTLLGEDRRLAEPLAEGLRRTGAEQRSRGGPPPTLGGNFEVEAFEPIPVPDPQAAAGDASAGDPLPLRFLAPFRLDRPPELKVRGAGYLNQDCFPAGHFLTRLWNRLFLVAHGRWPEAEERAAMPPIPAGAEAEPRGLVWLDVPVQGGPDKQRSYTLGGVLGEVALHGLTADWLPILAAGRLTHAGADTGFAFGAYEIAGPAPLTGHPLAPARPFLEAAASEAALERALDHVLADSTAAGVDGVTPEALSDRRDPALAELAAEIRSGRYRPSALAGWFQRKDDGGLRPLAAPTVRDRAAQRAACEAIGPSIAALASDLVEEWRWLAEALVWSLISRRRVRPEDFEPSPDLRWPCLLTRDARRRVLEAFEERLHTAFTPAEGRDPVTYREHLSNQALQLRRLITGEVPRYLPLRLHS